MSTRGGSRRPFSSPQANLSEGYKKAAHTAACKYFQSMHKSCSEGMNMIRFADNVTAMEEFVIACQILIHNNPTELLQELNSQELKVDPIKEILQSELNISHVSTRQTISLERVVVPLLKILLSIKNSQDSEGAQKLLGMCAHENKFFHKKLRSALVSATQIHCKATDTFDYPKLHSTSSFKKGPLKGSSLLWEPKSIFDVFLTILQLLDEILPRLKLLNDEKWLDFAEWLTSLTDVLIISYIKRNSGEINKQQTGQELPHVNIISQVSEAANKVRRWCKIKIVGQHPRYRRIDQFLSTYQSKVNNHTHPTTRVVLDKHEQAKRRDDMRSADGPGHKSTYSARHNNDNSDIAQISILPTFEELVCYRSEYLARNTLSGPHFMDVSVETNEFGIDKEATKAMRLIDNHFRALRFDALEGLKQGFLAFLMYGGMTDRSLGRMYRFPQEFRGQIKSLHQTHGNNIPIGEDTIDMIYRICPSLPMPNLKEDKCRLTTVTSAPFLHVYRSVRYRGVLPRRGDKMNYVLEFEFAKLDDVPERGKREMWDKSNALKFGSLVLIMSWITETGSVIDHNFDVQMYFGIVTDRNLYHGKDTYSALMERGNKSSIGVSMPTLNIKKAMQIGRYSDSRVWYMLQSHQGFFQASAPILHILQKMEPERLPFGKYIATTKRVTHMNLPSCFIGKVLDLSRLVMTEAELQKADGVIHDETGEIEESRIGKPRGNALRSTYIVDSSRRRDLCKRLERFPANKLNSHEFPFAEVTEFCPLDTSQLRSLIHLLGCELGVLQGPPGTGKTYVGVYLVLLLLDNRELIGNRPILVPTLTNHALDNFLMDLHKAGVTKLCRIGSQSKEESLVKYNLQQLLKEFHDCNRYFAYLSHQAIDAAVRGIEHTNRRLKQDIVYFENIMDYIQTYENTKHKTHAKKTSESDSAFESTSYFLTELDKSCPASVTRSEMWLYWLSTFMKRSNWPNKMQKCVDRILSETNEVCISRNPFDVLSLDEAECKTPNKFAAGEIFTSWSQSKRKNFYFSVVQLYREDLQDEFEWHVSEFDRNSMGLKDTNDRRKANVLEDVHVVGCTTNGAATNAQVLGYLGCQAIVVEEAGEVLESHILSILTENTNLLALIGDHQQLRPSVENYSFSMDNIQHAYNYDMSLFERLVMDVGLPFETLETQRRMRPCIADLIRTKYPNLKDHISVTNYPPLSGVSTQLIFVDHRHEEDKPQKNDIIAQGSKSNAFEVEIVVRTVRYMIQQGYGSEQLVVLTPYMGQLIKLRRALLGEKHLCVALSEKDEELIADEDDAHFICNTKMKVEHKQVNSNSGTVVKVGNKDIVKVENKDIMIRVATIDNYQGEEADVVLLSLVRNCGPTDWAKSEEDENITNINPDMGNIGFLRTDNRTNVLLSRAKHGMIIFGNADMLEYAGIKKGKTDPEGKCGMWKPCIDLMRKNGNIFPGLPIYCQKHPDYKNVILKASDFDIVAVDGGCMQNCNTRLSCGHACPRKCHPDDPTHEIQRAMCDLQCKESCKHCHVPCANRCNEPCDDKCGKKLEGSFELPKCSHYMETLTCWESRNLDTIKCPYSCAKRCEHCGIQCSKKCIEPCDEKCGHKLNGEFKLPTCDHCIDTLTCWESRNLDTVKCPHPCARSCEYCGVSCRKKCIEPCEEKCDNTLEGPFQLPTCGHYIDTLTCWQSRNIDAVKCPYPCTKSCAHCGVSCINKCSEPCDKKCGNKVNGVYKLECGHCFETLTCWESRNLDVVQCLQQCAQECQHCGVQCMKRCNEPCDEKCGNKFEGSFKLPKCSHNLETLTCWERRNLDTVKCPYPCAKRCEHCGIQCRKKCIEPCDENCGYKLNGEFKLPTCGHSVDTLTCWKSRNLDTVKCPHPCTKSCEHCGVSCSKKCIEPCEEKCGNKSNDEFKLPTCGHYIDTLTCWQRRNIDTVIQDPLFKCPYACNTILKSCGHRCSANTCCVQKAYRERFVLSKTAPLNAARLVESVDEDTSVHPTCMIVCQKSRLTCGHVCKAPCCEHKYDTEVDMKIQCPPGQKTRSRKCEYAKCTHVCARACSICAETCSWKCEHQGSCLVPCGVPCVRLPCNKRCEKRLPLCGHQCPTVCGETCPADSSWCQQCSVLNKKMVLDDYDKTAWENAQENKDQVVDLMMKKRLCEIDLNKDPLCILSCGHAFTMRSLDSHVGMDLVYAKDPTTDSYTGLKYITRCAKLGNNKSKSCPHCNAPIDGVKRCGRIRKYTRVPKTRDRFQTSVKRKAKKPRNQLPKPTNEIDSQL